MTFSPEPIVTLVLSFDLAVSACAATVKVVMKNQLNHGGSESWYENGTSVVIARISEDAVVESIFTVLKSPLQMSGSVSDAARYEYGMANSPTSSAISSSPGLLGYNSNLPYGRLSVPAQADCGVAYPTAESCRVLA